MFPVLFRLSSLGMMRLKINQKQIYLPDCVGRGYGTYWHWKGRYRVCKEIGRAHV